MTLTSEQADLIADALFEHVPMQQVWRVASVTGARNHAELDLFIAMTMFGNCALRIREAMGEREAWEYPWGACADCEAATGGVCSNHSQDDGDRSAFRYG